MRKRIKNSWKLLRPFSPVQEGKNKLVTEFIPWCTTLTAETITTSATTRCLWTLMKKKRRGNDDYYMTNVSKAWAGRVCGRQGGGAVVGSGGHEKDDQCRPSLTRCWATNYNWYCLPHVEGRQSCDARRKGRPLCVAGAWVVCTACGQRRCGREVVGLFTPQPPSDSLVVVVVLVIIVVVVVGAGFRASRFRHYEELVWQVKLQ